MHVILYLKAYFQKNKIKNTQIEMCIFSYEKFSNYKYIINGKKKKKKYFYIIIIRERKRRKKKKEQKNNNKNKKVNDKNANSLKGNISYSKNLRIYLQENDKISKFLFF